MESRTDRIIREHREAVIRGHEATRELAKIAQMSTAPCTDDAEARFKAIVECGISYATVGKRPFGRINDYSDLLVAEGGLSLAEADVVRWRIVCALWERDPLE